MCPCAKWKNCLIELPAGACPRIIGMVVCKKKNIYDHAIKFSFIQEAHWIFSCIYIFESWNGECKEKNIGRYELYWEAKRHSRLSWIARYCRRPDKASALRMPLCQFSLVERSSGENRSHQKTLSRTVKKNIYIFCLLGE